ncbi:MAG: T9SS type A sorting domain-containing protein [Crocinitomicaceae bacterium]|nr:T9SS type A sorting domain-containing protein [Crocinitomicaceae bacterium]
MKNLLLLISLIGTYTFGQTTMTSVQDGNFFGIGTWDCGICVPQDGDTVFINHTITMNTGIPYTAGSITINTTGTLTDGGVDKDIYINGGQLINWGTLECDGFMLDSGFFKNIGTMTLDSLWIQDSTRNTGTIIVYDFLNDQDGKFYNEGEITVTNNFNNQELFENYLWGTMSVGNDASNCNIQSSMAEFKNNGILCVAGDFTNCNGDTLGGINGTIYIAGSSSNLGHVEGLMTINTPTSGFSLNTGTIGTGISFGNATCILAVEESAIEPLFIYPNPAQNILNLSSKNVNYTIVDFSGRTVLSGNTVNGQIEIESLNPGTYLILINGSELETIKQTFVKL